MSGEVSTEQGAWDTLSSLPSDTKAGVGDAQNEWRMTCVNQAEVETVPVIQKEIKGVQRKH